MVDSFGALPPAGLPSSNSRHGMSMVTLYEDGERCALTVLRRDASGEIVPFEFVAQFTDLILTRVDERDGEVVQTILADKPKLYAFGRDHRIYAFSAVLLDTNLTQPIVRGAATWTGRSAKEWRAFYDEYAAFHVAAQRRWVVQLTYARRSLYGAVIDMQMSRISQRPHEVELIFNFYVSFEGTRDFIE